MVNDPLSKAAEIFVRGFVANFEDEIVQEMIENWDKFSTDPRAQALNDALIRELRRRMGEKGPVH